MYLVKEMDVDAKCDHNISSNPFILLVFVMGITEFLNLIKQVKS